MEKYLVSLWAPCQHVLKFDIVAGFDVPFNATVTNASR